jgi:arginine/serine-rich splicing factor 7
MSRYGSDCKVYVGDLGNSASKQELEDAFRYYGPLRNVWVARNPPGFAFVEFEDARDAEDAIRGLGRCKIKWQLDTKAIENAND